MQPIPKFPAATHFVPDNIRLFIMLPKSLWNWLTQFRISQWALLEVFLSVFVCVFSCMCSWTIGCTTWSATSKTWSEEGKELASPSAVTLYECACLHECFSECICLTSNVLAQLCCDLLAAHQDHFSLALAWFRSVFLSVCSSSRQPDSHRSPAQMPWPTLHVCKCVCVNVCVRVCAHLLLALSRTASQFVTTLPHISVSASFSPFLSFPHFLFLPFSCLQYCNEINEVCLPYRQMSALCNCTILHLTFICATLHHSFNPRGLLFMLK